MSATAEHHAEIMRRLRSRHAEDIADAEVYVPDGRGAGMGSQRMDFFAIACSWARPVVTAYEVKVSRQDFVRDDKWPAYLPCCHLFTFVTAPGVCTIGEIPAEAGWQELSANGKMLVTRKKAPRHPMGEKTEAFIYKHLLMRHFKKGLPSRDQWQDWLSEKRADRKLGHLVSKEIRHTVKERIDAVNRENEKLVKAMENYDVVVRALETLEISPEEVANGRTWALDRVIRQKVEAQHAGKVLIDVEALAKQLKNTADLLTRQEAELMKVRERVQEELSTEAA